MRDDQIVTLRSQIRGSSPKSKSRQSPPGTNDGTRRRRRVIEKSDLSKELEKEFMEDYVDAYELPSETGRVTLNNILTHARCRLSKDMETVRSMIPTASGLHEPMQRLETDLEKHRRPLNLYEILQFRSRLDNIAEERDVELERELINEHKNLIDA